MKIERKWAMPNKWTFKIKPIKGLLDRYVGDGKGWIDPFAGNSVIAEYRNDINGLQPSTIDGLGFLKAFEHNSCYGILLDPPYSHRQLFKTYKTRGNNLKGKLVPMTEINNLSAPIISKGGVCISFGWNTNGLGIKRGFKIIEILLVSHGGHHNDTIVTVEKKVNDTIQQ